MSELAERLVGFLREQSGARAVQVENLRRMAGGASRELWSLDAVLDGTRHALGELLTCPFCVSQWFATGFAFGLVTSPRLTRQVAGLFAALEVADLLQYLRSGAEKLTQ